MNLIENSMAKQQIRRAKNLNKQRRLVLPSCLENDNYSSSSSSKKEDNERVFIFAS